MSHFSKSEPESLPPVGGVEGEGGGHTNAVCLEAKALHQLHEMRSLVDGQADLDRVC